MIRLINRYKRGVSPVIAVVLLIALTVAAAAVIWAVTNGIIGGGTASLNVRDAAATRGAGGQADNDMTVTGVFIASEELTIIDVTVVDDEGETESYSTGGAGGGGVGSLTIGGATTTTVPSGENTFSVFFNQDDTSFSAGSYEITVTFQASSGGSQQIATFNVNTA